MTNSHSIATGKDTQPGGLDVGVMPYELPEAAKAVLARCLEREQWLARVGLYGIVRGLGTQDMREFSAACERLVDHFKAMRAAGRADAAAELEGAARSLELRHRAVAELERRLEGQWLPRVVWAAIAAGLAGALVGALLAG